MGCNRKVKFLISELVRGWERVSKKVTFASDPALQHAIWRQNGFTYRKKLILAG